jgi:hypothetical protein
MLVTPTKCEGWMVEKIDLPFESSSLLLKNKFQLHSKNASKLSPPFVSNKCSWVDYLYLSLPPLGDPCPFPLLIYYKSLNYDTWALCNYALLVTMNWPKKKGLHLKILLFWDIYQIQIVQNIVQLSSIRRFNQTPLFLIHWNFGSN